jgi:hypothetical protein
MGQTECEKYFLSVLRFEPRSLGCMKDALANSTMFANVKKALFKIAYS